MVVKDNNHSPYRIFSGLQPLITNQWTDHSPADQKKPYLYPQKPYNWLFLDNWPKDGEVTKQPPCHGNHTGCLPLCSNSSNDRSIISLPLRQIHTHANTHLHTCTYVVVLHMHNTIELSIYTSIGAHTICHKCHVYVCT